MKRRAQSTCARNREYNCNCLLQQVIVSFRPGLHTCPSRYMAQPQKQTVPSSLNQLEDDKDVPSVMAPEVAAGIGHSQGDGDAEPDGANAGPARVEDGLAAADVDLASAEALPDAYPMDMALEWCTTTFVAPMELPDIPSHCCFASVPLNADGDVNLRSLGLDGSLMRQLFRYPGNIANPQGVLDQLDEAFALAGGPGFATSVATMDWMYLPVQTVVRQLARCYNEELDFFYLMRFCSRVCMLPSEFKVPQLADKWECLGMVTGPPYSGKSTVSAACLKYFVAAPAASRGLCQYMANKSTTLEDHYQLTKSNSQRLIFGPDEAALLLSAVGDSKRWGYQDIINLVCSPVLGSSSSKIDRSMRHHRVGGLVPCANLKYSQDVFDCGSYRRTIDCVIDHGMGPRTKNLEAKRYLKSNKDLLWASEQALVEKQLEHLAVTTGAADAVEDMQPDRGAKLKRPRDSIPETQSSASQPRPQLAQASSAQVVPRALSALAAAADVRIGTEDGGSLAGEGGGSGRKRQRVDRDTADSKQQLVYYWDGHTTAQFSREAEAFADALQSLYTDRAVQEPAVYDGLWGAFLHQAVLHACDRSVVSTAANRAPTVTLPDVVLAAPILPIAVHHRRKQLLQMTGAASKPVAIADDFCKELLSSLPVVDGMVTVNCQQCATRLKKKFTFLQGGRCIYNYLAALMTGDGPLELVPLLDKGKLPEVKVPANLHVVGDPQCQIEKGKAFLAQKREEYVQHKNKQASDRRRGSAEAAGAQV